MRRVFEAITSIALLGLLAACDSDDTGTGGSSGASTTTETTTTTQTTSGTGGDSSTGGAGGTVESGGGGAAQGGGGGGGGASCKSCAQMVQTADGDPTHACQASAGLLGDVIACTCQPDVCGGPGKGCEAVCAGNGPIDQACIDCDQTAAAGPCQAEFAACLADT